MALAPSQRISTRATGIVGVAILCSRVLGLIRELLFAGLFGAGRNLDAFLMAFRVPNMLRDLFAEGALSAAFITTFSKKIATEGDESAWRLANKVATLTGGLWQLTAQFPSLRRVGYKYRPDFQWRDEGVRTVLGLMAPAVIAASVVQVNVLVNSGFAARLGDGPVSWLNIAFRLMQLPLGIFGVAVGTVTLPLVSRNAAIGDIPAFRSALAHGMRLVMLLTIPSAIGLILLAQPIIGLIYEHGRFTPEATRQTAAALRFYAIGLAAYSAVKVLAPAFYALDKRHLPMLVSLLSILVNFCLNWFFTFHLGLGHRGLALSTSLVAITNLLLLYIMMRRYAGRLETGAMLKLLGKLLIAGAVLAAICWLALQFLFTPGVRLPEWQKILEVTITIALAAAAFFGATFLLRVNEVREVFDLVSRKFRS